jgi:hypothetical protein
MQIRRSGFGMHFTALSGISEQILQDGHTPFRRDSLPLQQWNPYIKGME